MKHLDRRRKGQNGRPDINVWVEFWTSKNLTLSIISGGFPHNLNEEEVKWLVGVFKEALGEGSSPSEPTGDYEIRDHVSYAVGDPYGMFDYIPHVVMPNGGILMSQDAIEEAWRRSHDFEPLEGWRASRYSESEGAQ